MSNHKRPAAAATLTKALTDEQVQGITEKMETGLVEAEQAKHDQADERRANVRQEREQAELRSHQDEAAGREQQEQAEAQARQEGEMERERVAVAHRAREAAHQTVQAVVRTAEVAGESTRQVARSAAEGAQRVATASAPTTGFLFWDVMLGMSGLQPGRSVFSRNVGASHADRADTRVSGGEQVIPIAEEVLTVGTQKVSTGVTSVRRYVVETPVERQVTLVRERVVVERRRPVTDKVSGEMLTEITIEITETDDVPVVGKTVRLKEEIVVRTERTEHVATVRDTVRREEVEIEHADARRPARLHAAVRG